MDERRSSTDLPRVTFWPRPAAKDAPIERDIFCDKCGYNLRGLKQAVCPECGTPFRPRAAAASQLPWKQRETRGFFDAYWSTVRLVLTQPKKFGLEVWEGGRIPSRESNRFRWATIVHAYLPLTAVFISLAGPLLPKHMVVPYITITGIFILLWLEKSTRLIIGFFNKQTMSADVHRRLVSLGHFTCAALALSPVHLALMAATGVAYKLEGPNGLLFASTAGAWGLFTLTQLVLWLRSTLLLVREAMNCNEGELLMIALAFIVAWVFYAALYLVGLPLAVYWFVGQITAAAV
jgi:hypothetical protein